MLKYAELLFDAQGTSWLKSISSENSAAVTAHHRIKRSPKNILDAQDGHFTESA